MDHETLDENNNNKKKKKVRVVKKIVKKKIIKKVPKRVPGASNSNHLGTIASPNPNVHSYVEIENPNVDIVGLREAEVVKNMLEDNVDECEGDECVKIENPNFDIVGSREAEDFKMLEVSDRMHNKLPDSDLNEMELQDSECNRIYLKDSDQKKIGLQDGDHKQIELMDSGQNQIELQDGDCNQIELQDGDHNQIKLQDGDQKQINLQDNDHNQIEIQDSEHTQIEVPDNDQKPIELLDMEHDSNTMKVDEKHEGEECVKEPLVKSETDGLESKEALSESKKPSEKMVASSLHMKQMKKIFIHGLGQETKEEDVRKVFEEIGEVVEVKLIVNFKTGKNRGCGFVRFATADLANLALNKYQNVEICGRPCHTSAIEGIDTILLNNIDKRWNKENAVEWLQKIGIKKIDEVVVVPDPDNSELNCGFAFLEFETKRDAQMAYYKLQNENVSGKHSNIKVSWASRFVDPVEEETHNIKSVYAENIPLSWDEKEVTDHFKMFGEIESIALAKNLWTAKRNDFAFINYKTREAALSCIEALTSKKSTSSNDLKGSLKVSLAKSIPKMKPAKTVPDSTVTSVSKPYQKAKPSRPSKNQYQNAYQSRQSQQNLPYLGVYNPPPKPKIMIGKHEDSRKDSESSTTAELVQLLREQASWKHGGPSSTAGHHRPPFVGKQTFTELESKSLYHHEPQAYHQSHLQIPNVTHHRPTVASFPRYDQQRAHYTSGSVNAVKPDSKYIQTRDQTTYPGSSSVYRRMH
ncbi:uncharacterized protein LOC143622944 [Bidens hawaiensis]|uniref:uncharacterized protein LOC143622944 n=1 Tax=Bidens hawaiensis TaxID=980011 RepID=UPI00404B4D53